MSTLPLAIGFLLPPAEPGVFFVNQKSSRGTDIRLPGAFAPCEARSCTVHSPMQQAPRLRTLLLIPSAVRRTPMPQPPVRPNSTIPLRKLFFKDNSRFLANFLRCSTSLRRCVQKSAGNRRGLIIAKTGRAQTPTVAPASGARQRHAGSCAGTVLLTEEKTGKISVVAWENYPQGTFRPAPRGP